MNVSTDKSIQPLTMVSEKPLVSENPSPQGPQDVLIYHVADPLELLRILTSKKIQSVSDLKKKESFTLYPGIPDGVTLCTRDELILKFSGGFAIVFDRTKIDGYFVPQSPIFSESLHLGGIKGGLDLSLSEEILSLSPSLKIEHPELSDRDLHTYAKKRNTQALTEFGIQLPSVTTHYCDFNAEEYQKQSAKIIKDYFIASAKELLSEVKHDIALSK